MHDKIATCWILCCLLVLSGCGPRIYMPVEPAYDVSGKVQSGKHTVDDHYLAKLNDDLKACAKRP